MIQLPPTALSAGTTPTFPTIFLAYEFLLGSIGSGSPFPLQSLGTCCFFFLEDELSIPLSSGR